MNNCYRLQASLLDNERFRGLSLDAFQEYTIIKVPNFIFCNQKDFDQGVLEKFISQNQITKDMIYQNASCWTILSEIQKL
jgi:hypothetical protein